MMDRNWLASHSEPILEPDLEIVDPHHHLWPHESPYGIYELDDLHTDTSSGHNIVQTVFIECGAYYHQDGDEDRRSLGETRYVALVAEDSDGTAGATIAGIVGHARLSMDGIGDVLDEHIEEGQGRFRGIRDAGAFVDPSLIPRSRPQPPEGLYRQRVFQRGATELVARDLTLEAWQYHYQLDDVIALAQAVPGLGIVVNHLGGPLGLGPFAGRHEEIFETIKKKMAELARFDTVYCKVGGIGMTRYGTGWEHLDVAPSSEVVLQIWGDLIRFAIDTFGPSRCMFESNFPVDGETVSYDVLWNAFKKVSSSYTVGERADLFAGTARRVYRLESPNITAQR